MSQSKMEEGEPEVHTTELTAFSAAHHPDNSNNIIMEDELTQPSATTKSIEGHDLVNSSLSSEQQQQSHQQNQQQQQQHALVRLPPFFKAAKATVTPNTEQQRRHQQHARQPAPFFPTAPVTMPSTASSSSNTAVDVTSAAAAAAAASSSPPPLSFSSTYSLFPPTSSSSSLDFTAAWVASTPFAAAAPLSISPPSDGCGSVGEGGGAGAAPLTTGAIYEQRPPHFLAPKIATVAPSMLSSATSSMSTASMLSSSSFGKGRPAANLIGNPQQQQQQLVQHNRPPFAIGSGVAVMDDQQSLFLQNHQPQFITPSVSVFRYPAGNIGGNSIININNNNVISSNSSESDSFAVAPPFFVPSVGVVGEGFGSVSVNNTSGGGGGGGAAAVSTVATGKFKYPLYNRHPASSTNQLGRHWKQMGSQTRQYLQPSIPLPASTRLASAAAKQLRGTSFLGGPPGSLSPLTPNKSWAQVVASSTPQQIKQQQQQQQNQQSLSTTSPSHQGEQVGDPSKQQQQPLQQQQHHPSAVKAGGLMPPPPPPPVAVVKPTRSASLRGLSGLGGVSTSSNRDFKSLLLRLKTALDKEREKWRPRGGGGVVAASAANESEEVITINGQPTVVSINKTSSSTITGQQRDDCIFWLGWVVRKLRFSEETMALSASLFDAILISGASAVAVTPENCRLVALICLLLSAKFSEEDADVPTTKDLLAVAEIGVDGAAAAAAGVTSAGNDAASVEAALQMERVILTALEWDLNRPTPLKFLEILHTLLLCHQPQLLEDVALGLTPAKHLERLTWKMQKIVASHQLAFSFRPAVLAVALLSVDLESIGVSDWQVVSATLEKICQVGGSGSANSAANGERHKLARCKNLIVRLLAGDRKAAGSGCAVVGAGGREGSVRAVSGGGGAVVRKAVPTTESWSETPEKKRTMTKLKRKHVPSESGGMIDVSAMTAASAASDANASSTATSTTSSTGSSSSKTTLKRVFNIAESPTCKSEARSEEEAAANRGGIAAADRFSALQGLCNYIY